MKPNQSVRTVAAIVAALFFCFSANAQTPAQENPPSARSAGSPPQYINVVHEGFKPGHGAAYDGMLSRISADYERFHIPAYWIEMRSITGPDEMLALNLFDSFGDMEKMASGLGAAVAAHPDLAGLQDRLLEENVSSTTNLLAVRVDAFSSRADTINFAKMRLLHLTVFHVRPGHEAEFAEAVKSISSAYEKVEGSPAWVMYVVIAGAPAPCYLMLTALSSLKDEDAAVVRRARAMEAAGSAVQQRLQEIARSAYDSIETNIYFVNPQLSHMPQEFTAIDPAFWAAKLSSAPANKTQ